MHSPERILEALAWLYGGTFDAPEPWEGHDSFLIFCGSNGAGDIYQRTSDGEFFEGNYACMFGVSQQVRHALAVTAPWEWISSNEFHDHMLHAKVTSRIGGGPCVCLVWHSMHEIPEMSIVRDTPEQAKEAARAAYLCWMRGRLALRGLEK